MAENNADSTVFHRVRCCRCYTWSASATFSFSRSSSTASRIADAVSSCKWRGICMHYMFLLVRAMDGPAHREAVLLLIVGRTSCFLSWSLIADASAAAAACSEAEPMNDTTWPAFCSNGSCLVCLHRSIPGGCLPHIRFQVLWQSHL